MLYKNFSLLFILINIYCFKHNSRKDLGTLMENELRKLLIEQQQNNDFHIPVRDEFLFYRRIQQGDQTVLLGDLDADVSDGMGILSLDSLRNIKYHLIILTSMIARFCIEGGLDIETAYTMSDYYIRKIDTAQNKAILSNLKKEIINNYTVTMSNLPQKPSYSRHVSLAIDYIERHITENISNKQIADSLSITADYLSRLFKKETAQTLTQYISYRKCICASYMLENSNASCTQIANFLGYASCSHFITHFKKHTGMTPETYRNSHDKQDLTLMSN